MINSLKQKYLNLKIYIKWRLRGKPVPPPYFIKHRFIKKINRKYKYKIFIETGTFIGDMIHYQIPNFEKLYSIELDENLFKQASKRFEKYKKVKVFKGDSGLLLPNLLKNEVKSPSVFWLDGHYSGGNTAKGEKDSPIMDELNAIFYYHQKPSVILIDDARLFNGKYGYPLLEELKYYISNKSYTFKVLNDIIVLEPIINNI